MQKPETARSTGAFVVYGVFFALLLLTRAGFARAGNDQVLYSIDELDLTLGAVDRYLGVPMTHTHWPGMMNQMVLVPILAVQFAMSPKRHSGLIGLNAYLADIYRDPWQTVFIARLAVAIVFSGGITFLMTSIRRITGSLRFAVLSGIVIVSLPDISYYSHTAVGNMMAFGLLAVAGGLILLDAEKTETAKPFDSPVSIRIVLAGALCGLALATRNTFVPLAFFFCGMVFLQSAQQRIKATLYFLVAAGLLLYLGCPPIWSEPVRWAKATLGNYVKTGSPKGLLFSLKTMVACVTWWFACVGTGGIIYGCTRRASLGISLVAAGSIAWLVIAASRSPLVEPRYFQSIVMILWITIAMVVTPAVNDLRKFNYSRRVRWSVGAIAVTMLALAVLFNIVTLCRQVSDARSVGIRDRLMASELEGKEGKRIAVSIALYHQAVRFASERSFRRILEKGEPMLLSGKSVADYLSKYGFDPAVAGAMAMNFNEKEFAFSARLRCILGAGHFGKVDILFFAEPATAARFGFETTDHVRDMLKEGEVDEMYLLDEDSGAAPPTWKKWSRQSASKPRKS